MKKVLLIIILGAIAGTAGLYTSGKLKVPNKISAYFFKKPIPELVDFSLPGLDDEKLKLSDWHGKIIVLNFWATWCPPCIREIPLLVKMQTIWQDQGVQFVGVAIDDKDKVQQFIQDQAINYPIMLGQMETIEIAKQMGNSHDVLPYTVIINREGSIIKTRAGEVTQTMLNDVIKPHIK